LHNYNYIFFDSEDSRLKKDSNGYRSICTKDLSDVDNIRLVSYPLDYTCFIIRLFFLIHNSPKINQIIKLPGRRLWFPFYYKHNFKDGRPVCFIISGRYISPEYLRYLKRNNPNAKFVKIHRDLLAYWKQRNPQFTDKIVKEIFDLNLTYDAIDAEKHGMTYIDEFESKINVPKAKNYPLSDVFFAGRAKDRLDKLIQIYDVLENAGLKCDYYLTNVPSYLQTARKGIIYAKKNMPYSKMLYLSVNSRCILEVNQEGAVGYTSRFLEAVIYNKKLITDNSFITNSKFFNPKYVHCFHNPLEIDANFIKQDVGTINYGYKNEFSPLHLVDLIDKELSLLDNKRTNIVKIK